MKRQSSSVSLQQCSHKKIKHNNEEENNNIIIHLDHDYSSTLLGSRIGQVSSHLKFELIGEPILHALNSATFSECKSSINNAEMLLSNWKRDGVYISQLLLLIGIEPKIISQLNLGNKKEFMMRAVKKDSKYLKYASEEIVNDREIVLTAVQAFGSSFKYVKEKYHSDKEIILKAIGEGGEPYAISYASDRLRNDRSFIMQAVSVDVDVLECVSREMQNDRMILLQACKKNGEALGFTHEKGDFGFLRNDKELVLEAVTNNGDSLSYASLELKKDREIVLAAVSNSGYALQYASKKLKNDREIVLTAIKQSGISLKFASEKLKNDRQLIMAAVESEIKEIKNKADLKCEVFELISTYLRIEMLEEIREKYGKSFDLIHPYL